MQSPSSKTRRRRQCAALSRKTRSAGSRSAWMHLAGRSWLFTLGAASACVRSQGATRPRARGAGTRKQMKREYDFSKAKRGPVIPVPTGKTRITIRLDEDVIAWFRTRVEKAGGGNYQSLINDALRQHIAHD